MNKILILGSYGSGKTTLSKKLGSFLGIPVFHLDSYYWKGRWETPSLGSWILVNKEIVKNEKWIIEGNYIKTLNIRLDECDTVIYLTTRSWECILRVIIRTLLNLGKSRDELPMGCKDRVDINFMFEMFLYKKKKEHLIIRMIEKYKKKVIFIHPSQVNKDYKTWLL